jgi:hypothetical protein
MASFDRKFEIIQPTLDRLMRKPLEVADVGLLNPQGTSPVPLIDGEIVQVNSSYKWARGTDAAKPGFFVIEDRGDYGVQASRKLSAIIGPTFEADTVVFDNVGVVTLGQALMGGVVNNALSGSVARWGLVAHAGANIVLGYVMRLPASNGNRLRFIQTFA